MPPRAADRAASPAISIVVWLAWGVMLAIALAAVLRFGRDIPLAEDWTMVPALTGNEPDVRGWLWSQNNEHRVPLPRLVYLAVLRASGGDFRSGMILSTLLVGGVTAAMLLAARRLRGHASLADAFFPLALLHLGHWINLAWGWQLQFVSSFALVSALLLVIAGQHGALRRGEAAVASVALVLLPFTGAIGLMVDAALAPWVLATAWGEWRGWRGAPVADAPVPRDPVPPALLVGALGAAGITGLLYFIGYERPPWNPPSPSTIETVKTAARFLALGFGPSAAMSWPVSVIATVLLLVPTTVLVAWRMSRGAHAARLRPLGLLCFGGAMAVLALGIGWGRAAQYPQIGLPERYVLFAVPAFCAAWFAWLLFGGRWGVYVHAGLLVAVVLILPANTRRGLAVRDWYVRNADLVLQDIARGDDAAAIARRHRDFLMHWHEGVLRTRIGMLQRAGIGPFAQAAADSGTR